MKTITIKFWAVIALFFISCSNDEDSNSETEKTISTFAGDGTTAILNNPKYICVDSQGNFFVTEHEGHQISKILPNGTVTVFAGNGTEGFQNGSGSSARFNRPEGICIDANDNLYVADSYNHCIRKITPSGVVSTFAGDPTNSGLANGSATTARFRYPIGIKIDVSGNLYVSDYLNHQVRKINSSGTVSTFAGSTGGNNDGTGSNAQFNYPAGLFLNSGSIFITEARRIRTINSSAQVTTYAGDDSTSNFIDGGLLSATFSNPEGGCFDTDGIMYIADYTNNRIRKITNGQVSTYIGDGLSGDVNASSLLDSRLDRPSDVLFHNGRLFLVDSQSNKIKVVQ
jgi:sugar lactone lactonase YvrE